MNPNYIHTIFECLPVERFDEFWIITAWNPLGETKLSWLDNVAADERLTEMLRDLELARLRIIGMATDERHGEPGWGVQCDGETALRIANDFKQEAVFHVAGESVDLVCCQTGTRTRLPSWSDLVRDPREVRLFTLSIGSPEGGVLDDEHIQIISKIISKGFPGFTLRRAEGYFKGEREDMVQVEIGTRNYRGVILAAQEIRSALGQEGIGVACNGIYQRVREWSDVDLILKPLSSNIINYT